MPRLRIELELGQQPANRGTNPYPGIPRFTEALAGQGDHPADQRLILDDCLTHGKDGTDVEHVDTQGQGSLARWHLAAGQYLNELTGGTGGILGRNHPHLYLLAIDHSLHRGDGLGLVILDGDEDQSRFEDMADDVDPFGDALGLFAHQTVITTDVGFTLGAIDDQDLDLLAASCQFDVGRETGAPQTDDACLMNAAHQIQWTPFAVVRPWKTLAPFIETVGLDMDTQLTQS